MERKEYDSLDECVDCDVNAEEIYQTANNAFNLLIDTMSLEDTQRILLRTTVSTLLDLQKKAFEHQKEPVSDKTIRIGSYMYKYEKIQEYGDKRIITGDEICEWIQRNHVEDVSIFVGDEGLYFSMTDVEDNNHYRESRLNWSLGRGKYEIYEDHFNPEA